MWKMLSNLPRHEHNHAFLLKHFGCADTVHTWFDSTSNFDTQFHCNHPGGGYCSRRICELPNGKLVAVCNDDMASCADLPVTKSDIRLHTLNLQKIAGVIAELTKDAFIYADVQATGETVNCIRIGYYMPRGTIRFPVLLGMATYDGDLDAVINYLLSREEPAIMMLPSIENVPQAKINAIKCKGSVLLGLQNLQSDDSLIELNKAIQVLQEFYKIQDEPYPKIKCDLFPTVPNADWKNIVIRFVDGHRVRVTCSKDGKKVEKVCNYTQMGMADGRGGEPNEQWKLLAAFAEEKGHLTWNSKHASDKNKARKKLLKEALQKFFGMYDVDPIEHYNDEKGHTCYRSKLLISPESDQ